MLAALVILPAVVGAVLTLSGRRAEKLAAPTAIGTAAIALMLAILVAFERPSVSMPFVAGAPFALAVDALSAMVVPTVAAVTLLVLIFAAGDIESARPRFFGLMLLFVAAVSITTTATTLTALLLAWEIMGATSYALIGFWWRDPARVSGGNSAFLTTRTADLGLYLATAGAVAGGVGLDLARLPGAEPGWRDVIAAGVLVAALGKAAQLPFSFWLSRAMLGPSPVSALLHSAAMVAMGGYLLLRMEPLLAATSWAPTVTAWWGVGTAVALGAVAVAQHDLKQALAASTGAQLGFVVLAAGVGSVAGGAAHLVAHAATKALLFLAAGAWLTALGTKKLRSLRGAARRWPLVGVCAGVGVLALAGVAPLSLWATKDEILAAAKEQSAALYYVGLGAAALSTMYAIRILLIVWRTAPTDMEPAYDDERPGTRHIGRLEKAPLVVLAVGAATLGFLALPPVSESVRNALGEATAPSASLTELLVSAALALLVLAAVAIWGTPRWSWAAGWLGLERVAHGVVVRPVLNLAEALARFDDRVIDAGVVGIARGSLAVSSTAARFDDRGLDRAVTGSSAATLRAADAVDRGDQHGLDAAVAGLAHGVRRLGLAARRLQTGQVHEYYTGAAVVVALSVLLLLVVR